MNGHREEQEVMTARLALFLWLKTPSPRYPLATKQSTASCLRRLCVLLPFSVAKGTHSFWGRLWCHVFLFPCGRLHFFVHQKSTVGFGRHQLSRRLRPAQHKSFKIRFLVFSQDTLGVQKKGGFPATVGLRRPCESCPGKSQGDVHVGPRF